MDFKKWDIIYTSRFPETIDCHNASCGSSFFISKYNCPNCNQENNVSNIIAKVRPIILWIDKIHWFKSMTFGIPLSASKMYDDRYNQIILLSDYTFVHSNNNYHKPMRAVVHQATRFDGNVFRGDMLVGKINNTVIQKKIEDKLLDWLWK